MNKDICQNVPFQIHFPFLTIIPHLELMQSWWIEKRMQNFNFQLCLQFGNDKKPRMNNWQKTTTRNESCHTFHFSFATVVLLFFFSQVFLAGGFRLHFQNFILILPQL